jgi:hypothetical protein
MLTRYGMGWKASLDNDAPSGTMSQGFITSLTILPSS